MLAIQYLEHSPELAGLDAGLARSRLHDALQRLPLDTVILGWSVPPALVDACAGEAARAGAWLYRWQPLLAGCLAEVDPGWRVVGVGGEPVPAYRDLPEFTFLCPNNEQPANTTLEYYAGALRSGPYQGVFLDRIRFPSPAADPFRNLGCFCEACQRAAAQEGLDLIAVRRAIQELAKTPKGRLSLVSRILSEPYAVHGIEAEDLVSRFQSFRESSITRFVSRAAAIGRSAGLTVGLDCFSPSLAHMVGQDLRALNAGCDWIKIMAYGHSLAPAGLPFELQGLAEWLGPAASGSADRGLHSLARILDMELPTSCELFSRQGVSSPELGREVSRARQTGVTTLLAGIELVDLAGVTALSSPQITADLRAMRQARPDGLVLSWDLWRIPPQRLDLVRDVWSR